MPMHMTREHTAAQGLDMGVGPPMAWGLVSPAAVQLGLGAVARMQQPDRLYVPPARPASRQVQPRLMNPRALDAGRILDFGAPAPARVVEYALYPFRPTEAPLYAQRSVALGGRLVGF